MNDMKLLIQCYKNNELISKNEFNHASFYEVPFVQLGFKFDIIETPEGYHANNLAGLRLRRSFKTNDTDKNIIVNSLKLSNEERFVLNIAINKNVEIVGKEEVDNLISNFRGLKIGNLEDINSWFEELNTDLIDKIEFVEKED